MEFRVAWSARLSREATDGDLEAADVSLMRDVNRATSGLNCAIRMPLVTREIYSHEDLAVDAESYEAAEAQARGLIEACFAEAGVSIDGLEID